MERGKERDRRVGLEGDRESMGGERTLLARLKKCDIGGIFNDTEELFLHFASCDNLLF